MSSFADKTVLVTGGASGIGFLMGKRSLERGARHLIIWDINEEKMNAAADQLRAAGHSVSLQQVDVSDPESIQRGAAKILAEHTDTGVDILFNNAGIVVGKAFNEHSAADISRTLNINTAGMMHVTNAFLGRMMERNSGHIINITSAAGLTPNPGMTVYTASKWAAVGWSESLRLELQKTHPGIHILNVMPSYINTGMFEGVKPPLLMPLLDPEKISERIIRAVEKNKLQLKAPFMVKLTLLVRGLLPLRAYDFVAGTIFRVYESMDTFNGHGHE